LSTAPLRGIRSGGASRQVAASLRSWARQAAPLDPEDADRFARAHAMHRGLSKPYPGSPEVTEAEMMSNAKRLALRHLQEKADLSTVAGRVIHARRLRDFHADGVTVDRRAVVAEATWRTAARW
jgi:hypothetical protein